MISHDEDRFSWAGGHGARTSRQSHCKVFLTVFGKVVAYILSSGYGRCRNSSLFQDYSGDASYCQRESFTAITKSSVVRHNTKM